MTSDDDLVKELKIEAQWQAASGYPICGALLGQAAARIAALEAERERLRAALDGAADDLNEAGRNLAELELTLSRDPWRSEHAHQCASEARAALEAGQ